MSELRQELQVDDMNLRRCVLNISAAEGAETAHHALSPIHSWSAPDSGVVSLTVSINIGHYTPIFIQWKRADECNPAIRAIHGASG